jgi:hypothetical protein
MNQWLDHWSVGDDQNERVSNEVMTYFRRAQIAN